LWMWMRAHPLRSRSVSLIPRLPTSRFVRTPSISAEPHWQRRQVALLTRVAIPTAAAWESTVIDTHNLAELHGVGATPGGFVLVAGFSPRCDQTGVVGMRSLRCRPRWRSRPYSVVDVDRGDVLFRCRSVACGRYLALGTTAICKNPSARVYPKRRSHCWRC